MTETDRPVRAVRALPKDERPGWRGLIHGTVEIDPDKSYERIASYLRSADRRNLSPSEIDRLLDESADVGHLADRLAARARRDYEVEKERREVWLEARRAVAREQLEERKRNEGLKKQITVDMVLDQVRANWPQEYLERKEALESFRAAVHALEALPGRCSERRNSLAKLADSHMARGAGR